MSFIQLEIKDRVALMTLNAPEVRNAIRDYDAVVDACREVQGNRSVGAVVLTGAGSAFCAGGDVKAMRERIRAEGAMPAHERYRYKEGIHRVPMALYELEVPVIAAINGPAIGAGLDLACMCDIRIASELAVFAESFVKLGIIPGDGGAWLLLKILGPERAAEMIFTGRKIDARQARELGLVSRVVEHDKLMEEAWALARRIAANPAHALRMSKRLLREAQQSSLAGVLELSAAFQAIAHFTPEHRELIDLALSGGARR